MKKGSFLRTELKAVGTDFTFIFTVLSSYTPVRSSSTVCSLIGQSPAEPLCDWSVPCVNHSVDFHWLQCTCSCARARTEAREFKVKMASKILLRACRLTLMGRQNILMKTPARAMAGKGETHSGISTEKLSNRINHWYYSCMYKNKEICCPIRYFFKEWHINAFIQWHAVTKPKDRPDIWHWYLKNIKLHFKAGLNTLDMT